MAEADQVQDGAGPPPATPAADFSSKDGWLASMKFTGTSAEDAQLWWNSFQLLKNFEELTNQRGDFPSDVKRWGHKWYLGRQ